MTSHNTTDALTDAQNTDRRLWPERGDYYADSIHVTAQGGIGIDCGGYVIVKTLREWHALASRVAAAEPTQELIAMRADLESLYTFWDEKPLSGVRDIIDRAKAMLTAAYDYPEFSASPPAPQGAEQKDGMGEFMPKDWMHQPPANTVSASSVAAARPEAAESGAREPDACDICGKVHDVNVIHSQSPPAAPPAQVPSEPVRWRHADGDLYEVLTLNARYKYESELWNDGYVVYRGEDNQIYVTSGTRFNKRFTRVPDPATPTAETSAPDAEDGWLRLVIQEVIAIHDESTDQQSNHHANGLIAPLRNALVWPAARSKPEPTT